MTWLYYMCMIKYVLELGFVWGINAIEFVKNSLVWKWKLKRIKTKNKNNKKRPNTSFVHYCNINSRRIGFFFFKRPCISPVVVLVGRPFVCRTVDWLHFVHLFRRRHYRIRHCRWRIFVAQHCKYKVNITSWNSWTVLYFILSIFGGSRFSFETFPSYHLYHAVLNPPQYFYSRSLARFSLSTKFVLTMYQTKTVGKRRNNSLSRLLCSVPRLKLSELEPVIYLYP